MVWSARCVKDELSCDLCEFDFDPTKFLRPIFKLEIDPKSNQTRYLVRFFLNVL